MKLIAYYSTDGLRLKGFLAAAEANQATIVHIHGNCGNFYENDFIAVMAERYPAAGINFLCVNNRGHDGIAEAYRAGQLVYIGGAYEPLEHCIYDIEGIVKFAEGFGAPIILQGHSLGCLKILTYLLTTRRQLDMILLSPSDSYRLQANYIHPEGTDSQIRRIRRYYARRLDALLPAGEFGIRQRGVEYYIPISARAFLALFEGSLIELLRYERQASYYVPVRAFVYCGGRDALQTAPVDVVQRFFTDRVRELRFCYQQDGDHHFHGLEPVVIE